jgi:DNA-binding beta-propeller fold protein YncE
MRVSRLTGLAVLGAVLVGGSCSRDRTGPVIVSLTVSPDTLHLHHGDTQLLSVAAVDGSGHAINGASLTFGSADTTVAVVSSAGLVTARKAGNTSITVSSGNAHQTAAVYVLAGAKVVEALPADTIIHVGGVYALTVTVRDSANLVVAGAPVTFASLDTTIVRVSPAGAVSCIGVGQTHVSVVSGPASVFVNVRVIDTLHTPTYIVSGPADTTVKAGTTYQLTTVVSDSVHATLPIPVTYGTADSTVATVSASGLVRAVGAGITTLQAKGGAISAFDTVQVVDSSIVAAPTLSGSPFGAAATHAGVVYVTRHSDNAASRFDLPGTTAGASIALDPNPASVAFDSGGTTAYVTSIDGGKVQVITVSTNTVTDSIALASAPFVVRVSPDDKSIFVTTNADTLYQVDRTTKVVLAAFHTSGTGNGIAFNPANDSMLYVSTQGVSVNEINYKRSTVGRTFTPGGTTQGVVVSPDGTKLYVANEATNRVDAIDLATGGSPGFVPTSGGGAFDLQLSADGTKLWASLSGAGRVDLYDRATLTLIRTVKTGGTPRRIAVSPASSLVVVANEAGSVAFIK